MIFIIDNYDSFTYNLVQYLGEFGQEMIISRNDAMTVAEIAEKNPSVLVISPGPCAPNEAGISIEAIQTFAGKIPILGVGLGHQAIAQAFGGEIVRAKRQLHGKTAEIFHHGGSLFSGIENPCLATCYHSFVVNRDSLPTCFEITALSKEGEIMGLRHKELAIEGVQFHPESILTPYGKQMLQNFFRMYGETNCIFQ